MHRFLCLLLLASAPALAADKFLGRITASSGASRNSLNTGNVKADGTAGALTLPTSPVTGRPVLLAIQCDVPVRYTTGTGADVAATNTPGAGYGPKIDTEQLYPFTSLTNAIAIIPASGSGSANCDVYQRSE